MFSVRQAALVAWRTTKPFFAAGLSRTSAIRSARKNVVGRTRPFAAKAALMVGGSMLVSTGVALLVSAELGLGPIDILISGLSARLGISFGQASWLFSAAMITICVIARARPGLGTVVFLGSIGFFVDRALQVIDTPDSLAIRAVMFTASIGAIALGISTVAAAGMGAGTFELLTDRAVSIGMSRTVFRTCLDATGMVIGLLLGGSVGFGTPIMVLAIGPSIAGTSRALGDLQRGRQERLSLAEPVTAAK